MTQIQINKGTPNHLHDSMHLPGFPIRAGGRENSPAISRELTANFSLEINQV